MGSAIQKFKKVTNPDLAYAYQCKIDAPLAPISSKKECDQINELVDSWMSHRKTITNKEAYRLISEVILHTAKKIEDFESIAYDFTKSTPAELLQSFMSDHNLKQKDLAIYFGSQGIVSEVCNGKRDISLSAAKKLGKKFGVSPTLFILLD